MIESRVTAETLDAAAILSAALAEAADGSVGAVASFVGLCRATGAGGVVNALELEHYPGFTENEIRRIAEAAAKTHGLAGLRVIHRYGRIAPGEAIVVVVATSSHRAAAFAAVEAVMDYLKTDAPFWKREIGPAGARWIEPTAQDHARRAQRSEP